MLLGQSKARQMVGICGNMLAAKQAAHALLPGLDSGEGSITPAPRGIGTSVLLVGAQLKRSCISWLPGAQEPQLVLSPQNLSPQNLSPRPPQMTSCCRSSSPFAPGLPPPLSTA